ncbi:3-oxoadipyl-CoA thiolase [Lysobacter sp. A6]|uniref:Beta-ketoadipyl-CoA thiolase n=1 Tax=Noviluteimonas lactosilytica TaxID=2888523 RepID=A0ABS8JGS1_9GAMM|nr:3-oxoadipyl-CoA thiolase [Lysobacter lactosilyticus]MCC8362762.1 3-oxoadipyl-CoA thiolase [Lysobacter lactosilyticus]
MSPARTVFVCDGVRTPFGRHRGGLSMVRTDDLAALPIRHLLDRHPGIDASIDDVILGCANQAGEDNRNVARMAALLAGLPVCVPGVTVNRLCASGLEAVGQAARAIAVGEADLVVAGGVEGMSRAPYVLGKADAPFAREQKLEDTTLGWRFVNPAMVARHGIDSMTQTAENLAREHDIAREDQDAFALRSQQRAARAIARGRFASELMAVGKCAADEQPRADTSHEKLATLAPLLGADGTITAGNASGLNDGACALLLASGEAVARHDLVPRARILGMAAAGVPPRTMGLGPVPAIERLLQRIGLGLDAFDVIELNEAFAAQVLACTRALGLADDSERINPNGGAIALGHPLGASGARLALTATHQLQETGGGRALLAMCVGVGQGVALAMERVS